MTDYNMVKNRAISNLDQAWAGFADQIRQQDGMGIAIIDSFLRSTDAAMLREMDDEFLAFVLCAAHLAFVNALSMLSPEELQKLEER